MRIIHQGLPEHRTIIDSLQIRKESSKDIIVHPSLEDQRKSLAAIQIWRVWTRVVAVETEEGHFEEYIKYISAEKEIDPEAFVPITILLTLY